MFVKRVAMRIIKIVGSRQVRILLFSSLSVLVGVARVIGVAAASPSANAHVVALETGVGVITAAILPSGGLFLLNLNVSYDFHGELEGTFASITDETLVISPDGVTTAHVIGLFQGTAKGVPCDAVITEDGTFDAATLVCDLDWEVQNSSCNLRGKVAISATSPARPA
jgi:hypothetical protein